MKDCWSNKRPAATERRLPRCICAIGTICTAMLFFDWEMKVRNTGSEDTIPDETVLRVWFRYLDENGDVIAETQSEAGKYSPVKSGQAEWIQINSRLGEMDSSEVEATAFIEIFAYTKKVRTKPEVYYEEPILIDIRDFVKE